VHEFHLRRARVSPERMGASVLTRTESGVCKGHGTTHSGVGQGSERIISWRRAFRARGSSWELSCFLVCPWPCQRSLPTSGFQLAGHHQWRAGSWDLASGSSVVVSRKARWTTIYRALSIGPLFPSSGGIYRMSSVRSLPLFPLVRFPSSGEASSQCQFIHIWSTFSSQLFLKLAKIHHTEVQCPGLQSIL